MRADTLEVAQAEGRAPWDNVEISTREFIVYKDAYPVTDGHILIVPRIADGESIMKCFELDFV